MAAGTSKCPKCGKTVAKLHLESVPAGMEKKTFPAVVFSCPACRTVLGVQIDPVTVSASTVKRLATALKGGKAN
jgi:predicted RNA-binding Zn-ribbon protein involved in translation (DUF1610 family)